MAVLGRFRITGMRWTLIVVRTSFSRRTVARITGNVSSHGERLFALFPLEAALSYV